jgi:outer membrane lipoprotein-sorting protein
MKQFTYSIVVLIISIHTAFSQNNTDAETVINNYLASVKTSAIRTNFKLIVTEKNKVNSQTNSGMFTLKGNKFVLEMDETKAWFDGKTQWAYVAESNEVSITEPTVDEIASINPLAILAGYKAKSNVRFSKTKSAQNHIIELMPKNKNNDFSKITVQINKANNQLVSIIMIDKKANITTLLLQNYQKVTKLNDDFFVFNKNAYKNVTINDLR